MGPAARVVGIDADPLLLGLATGPQLAAVYRTCGELRGPEGVDHHLDNPPTLDEHVLFLQEGGFGEVGVVWQHGDNRVLVAVR